ncbi:MAG: hypothetical protein Q8P41_05185 [Pseudomonadota bacterium]|nr:hypothetical protein [Pseudomonadota bacterium]
MSLVLLAASSALAASPVARVGGLGAARAVTLLAQRTDEVAVIACNDAGTAPDATADGIWTCGPLPPVSGPVHLGLARDGRLLDAGTTTFGADLSLAVQDGAVVLGADLAPTPAAAPNPGAPTVLARVTGLGDGSAPVVRLQAPQGAVEVMCRDDGVFPDDARNDGVHGCAGPAPGPRAEVFINGKDGATRSYGSVAWDLSGPVVYLVVDGAAGNSRVETFPIVPFPAVDKDAGGPPPEPTPVTPPDPVAPPSPDANQPPPGDAPERSPVATREALPSGAGSPLALLVAFALGAGGAVLLRRRAARLPASLVVHPAPPLLPGGPTLADGPVALRADDPLALAAAILPALARQRRVVLVAPPDAALPPVADGPVYRAALTDCEEVEAAVRALARTPGPPVAVLVVGDSTLTDPGAVAPDAVRKLREGLGAGVWLGVLVAGPAPAGLPSWTATGPPWALTRA